MQSTPIPASREFSRLSSWAELPGRAEGQRGQPGDNRLAVRLGGGAPGRQAGLPGAQSQDRKAGGGGGGERESSMAFSERGPRWGLGDWAGQPGMSQNGSTSHPFVYTAPPGSLINGL